MSDIFAIQDEIGRAISHALQLRLAPRTRATNLEAYQFYLMGQYHYMRTTAEGLAKAKESFERALTIDPNYAPAHSGLAAYYYTLGTIWTEPLAEAAPLAKSAAQKALAIDPGNAEAHSVLGIVSGIFDYDWESAERHHLQAMAEEPVSPMVRVRYAYYYLLYLGRLADAREQWRQALENDPVSMLLHFGVAICMYAAREYREAMEYARKAMEIDANFYPMWVALGHAQLGAGCTQDAIASFERAVEIAPWDLAARAVLAGAYYRSGDRERSRECLTTLSGWQLARGELTYYALTGEADAMFDAFERAYQRRDWLLPFAPFYDPYRADPRFQSLLRRMNLT
jgi:Tfp pilus assembly protein PilF